MSAFDDYSFRGHYPAGMELVALLNFSAVEGELFGDLPVLQFVSRYHRYLDRGKKWEIYVWSVRTEIERFGSRGNGNRARRRAGLEVLNSDKR